MVSLGIDIGGTSVKAALLRDDQFILTSQSDSYSKPGTDQLITAIRNATAGMEIPGVIGLCCPGLLDRASRTINIAVNLPGLIGLPLDELLTRAFTDKTHLDHAPAQILSDAAATAYDFYLSRSLAGRLLCLTIGTGVGASVIDNRQFLHISGETPGHFGQLDVSLDDTPPIGPDGGAGSLEAYIGAAALAAKYGEKATEKLTAGDPAIRALVRAIRIAHAIYRPAHVALAGGIGIRLAKLLSQIKSAVDQNLTRIARADWTLFTGETDFHAARGAARYALHAIDNAE